jgi:glucose-6-phosphate 1-dehydrogenase
MPYSLVIFGASGDLTSRKLVPALYWLYRKRRLPDELKIVGFSRSPLDDQAWRDMLAESTAKFVGGHFDAAAWRKFAASIYYHAGDVADVEDFRALKQTLGRCEEGKPCVRVYYLATAPQFFENTVANLGASGLADGQCGQQRLVVEKPFGTDLATARRLNEALHRTFREEQIFRIDHYLGKETVQNILVFRFANAIFEPVWNRNFIDHVEITAAESVDVGRRAGYYETAGVLRDMFQSHLLQLLAIVAMEAPSRFEASAVRNEKVKVLEAIRPWDPEDVAANTVRAQYDGYRDEPGVAPDSQTATFAAVKLLVDNWRWQGVPFYLRSGKAMSCRTTQIVIQFRQPPHLMFNSSRSRHLEANRLVIQIQPDEGIQLHLQTKVPDEEMKLRLTELQFRFAEAFKSLPDAYEHLLLDVLEGDQSLFARRDEVELSWGIIDPIHQAWHELGLPDLATYERDGWGPKEASKWIWKDGRDWLDVCPVLREQPDEVAV